MAGGAGGGSNSCTEYSWLLHDAKVHVDQLFLLQTMFDTTKVKCRGQGMGEQKLRQPGRLASFSDTGQHAR